MAKKGYKKLGEEEFNRIKSLFNAGVDIKTVHSVTGRSVSTLRWVERAPTLGEYRTMVRDYVAYQRRTRAERLGAKQLAESQAETQGGAQTELALNTVTAPVGEDSNKEEPKPLFYNHQEQSSVELTRIADALERLATAWESSPEKKKGLFG